MRVKEGGRLKGWAAVESRKRTRRKQILCTLCSEL